MIHLLLAAAIGGCNAPHRMGTAIGDDTPARQVVAVDEADDASGKPAAYFYRLGSGQWFMQPLVAKVQRTVHGEVTIFEKPLSPHNAQYAPLIAVPGESAATLRNFFKVMHVPAGAFDLRTVKIYVCSH